MSSSSALPWYHCFVLIKELKSLASIEIPLRFRWSPLELSPLSGMLWVITDQSRDRQKAFIALFTSFLLVSRDVESFRGVSSDIAISHPSKFSSMCSQTLMILSATAGASSVASPLQGSGSQRGWHL